MAIKLADVIENANSNYPVIDADASGASGIKGFGIFNGFGAGAGERGSLPANKQCTGYIAVDSGTGKVEVYTGGGWTTASNWKSLLDLSNLPDPQLTTDDYVFDSIAHLLSTGNATNDSEADGSNATEHGAYLIGHTSYEGVNQQFKFTTGHIIEALLITAMTENVNAGAASSLDVYAGSGSGLIGDFNGDGIVNTPDLLLLLGYWELSAEYPGTGTYFINENDLSAYISGISSDFISQGDTAQLIEFKMNSDNSSYVDNSKLYIPIVANTYTVVNGAASTTINATGAVDGTDYVQFGNPLVGDFEISALYTSVGGTTGTKIITNNSSANFTIVNEGPNNDTVSHGFEVTLIDNGGNVLQTAQGDDVIFELIVFEQPIAGGSVITLNSPGFNEIPQITDLDIALFGFVNNSINILSTDYTDDDPYENGVDIPITGIRVKPFFRAEQGTSLVRMGAANLIKFSIKYQV